MRPVVCDASILVKWFVEEPGPELAPARALLTEVRRGELQARLPELAHLEVGNALAVRRRWSAARVARVLTLLRTLAGRPIPARGIDLELAAELATRHRLTLYDASYWALAHALGATLVTADRPLIAAGAGEGPASFCTRLGL